MVMVDEFRTENFYDTMTILNSIRLPGGVGKGIAVSKLNEANFFACLVGNNSYFFLKQATRTERCLCCKQKQKIIQVLTVLC